MALSLSTLTTGAGNGASSYTTSTFTSPSSGDLLIVGYVSGSNRDATISDSSGSGSWVSLSDASAAAFATRWWYKIANGSETDVSFSLIGGTSAVDWFVVQVTGWTGTPTLEGTVGEDEAYMSTAATSTVDAGSTTNSTANALVLAFFSADQPSVIDAGRSVSDGTSYTEQTAGSGDGQVFLYYREVSSTGTYTPVYSFTDTGDQAYGAVAVFGDVSAGSNYTITGSVTHTLTPAATFSINRQHSIAGAVSYTLTPSATLAINRAYTLTGAVTHTLTPSASMAYTAAGTASITGNVTYTLTPSAAFAINRAYTLTGSVSHTLAVAASMQYTAQQAIEFVGAVTYTLTPAAVMVGPAVEAETASLAGLRVHAAREMPFFFSRRSTRRRTSRASWPTLRAA